MKYSPFSQSLGSSLLSPAHPSSTNLRFDYRAGGRGGARANIKYVSAPLSAEKSRADKQAGKNSFPPQTPFLFCPPASERRRGGFIGRGSAQRKFEHHSKTTTKDYCETTTIHQCLAFSKEKIKESPEW